MYKRPGTPGGRRGKRGRREREGGREGERERERKRKKERVSEENNVHKCESLKTGRRRPTLYCSTLYFSKMGTRTRRLKTGGGGGGGGGRFIQSWRSERGGRRWKVERRGGRGKRVRRDTVACTAGCGVRGIGRAVGQVRSGPTRKGLQLA